MGGGWVREGGGKKTLGGPDGVFPPPSCIGGGPTCGGMDASVT
jgi:hypothetical protein